MCVCLFKWLEESWGGGQSVIGSWLCSIDTTVSLWLEYRKIHYENINIYIKDFDYVQCFNSQALSAHDKFIISLCSQTMIVRRMEMSFWSNTLFPNLSKCRTYFVIHGASVHISTCVFLSKIILKGEKGRKNIKWSWCKNKFCP